METRKLRVLFTKGGSGSVTTKVTLPKKWIDEMGISQALREIEVSFDGERIIIERFKDRENKGGLIGMKWGELEEDTREALLDNANVWDDVKEGDCIFDLTENLSVSGRMEKIGDEYVRIVDEDSIIYDPEEGIL